MNLPFDISLFLFPDTPPTKTISKKNSKKDLHVLIFKLLLYCNNYNYSMSHGRFAINIHILTILSHMGKGELEGLEWVPSEFIASSIDINPVLVRKEISHLRKAGLVQSKEGKNGGSALAKPAYEIFLSDVYKSVYEKPVLGNYKAHPNSKCPIAVQINEHLDELYKSAEDAILEKLGCTTLQQFSDKFS